MQKTAVIIIIGNEILSGRVQDTNSHFLASELRELGVDVKMILCIPDEIDAIAREVGKASESFDYVFTSGGVGPTHDDLTMEAIAKGFGLGLKRSEKIMSLIRSRCAGDIPDEAFKMAMLPEGAEVIEHEENRFPTVAVKNVYIFPGIPSFLRLRFSLVKERFRSRPYHSRKVFIKEEECFFADVLVRVSEKHPEVSIGSYPKVDEPDYKVVVTLESTDINALDAAFGDLMGGIEEDVILRTE